MNNFNEYKLFEIANISAGGDVPKEAFSKEKTPRYKIPIISNGVGNEAVYGYTNIEKISKPCVTIAARGTIGYTTFRSEPFYPIIRLICIVPKQKKVVPKYLYYCLSNARFAGTNAGIPQLTVPMVSRHKIKLPDLETQQKIVQILDTWNDAIELLDKRILSEKEKFAIFQHNLFMNSDYDKVPLGHLSTMHSGGTPNSKVADFYGGDILWVSIADMTSVDNLYLNETKKHLTKKGFDSSSAIKIHPKGSVLYAMYASIGECVIAGRDMTSSQAILGINCKTDKLYNKYLYYYLTSNKQKIKTLGQQGTQSNLNAKMVKEFEIPLPPLEMQVAISKKLDAQVKLIQYLEDNKKHYLTQYKYLLNHLISGDFDLTNIKLEKGKE